MCLIIHAKPEHTISEELMECFARRNDDGFGVMWIENNKINAKKFGPTEMDQLYPTYESLKHQEHFIHLRMRTHGNVDAEMAHPYYCGYGIWLMHNGVLPTNGVDQSKSDTWHFINDVLNPLFKEVGNPHHFMRSKVFNNIMKQYLGTSNRIVMGDRGGYVLFNRSTWHTIDNQNTGAVGLLVSNTYAWTAPWKTTVPTTVSRRTGGYHRGSPSGDDLFGNDANLSPAEEELFLDRIKNTFFCIGRHWYVNAQGMVFRRRGRGFERRSDLDDNDQFWNTFDRDKIIEASVWSAGTRGIEIDHEDVARALGPEDVTPPAQLAINWDNPPADATSVQTPTGVWVATENGVLVRETSMHQNMLH